LPTVAADHPIVGGLLLLASGVMHFDLRLMGYRYISVVGKLFLVQAPLAVVLAFGNIAANRWMIHLGGAVLLAFTESGLLVSVYTGLFGFPDRPAAPYAWASLAVEISGFLVLAIPVLLERSTRARLH
jgi:hypothetical protein